MFIVKQSNNLNNHADPCTNSNPKRSKNFENRQIVTKIIPANFYHGSKSGWLGG